MVTRFGFTAVAPSFLSSEEQIAGITDPYMGALAGLGGRRYAADDLTGEEQLFLLVATGGTEEVVLSLVQERWAVKPGEPVFLISHPANNSLPAALEVLARLHQDGAKGRVFYVTGPDDSAGLAKVARAADDISVLRALHETRVGLVGDPSAWLVASMPDAETVKRAWGPTVVPITMDELTTRLPHASAEAVKADVASLVSQASACQEPTDSELADVARVHQALRQLVDAYDLDAMTVRCFDLVLNLQTTGCFGLAELTDAGIIAGCEGDLVTTVGLIWTNLLLGETPWMANPAQLDEAANEMWLAHCTIPRGMVASYRLRSHFESGLGVGIQGDLPLMPVTLLRIGGAEMDKLWVAEGEIIAVGDAEDLCRTQAKVRLGRGHVSDLLRAPLGNHLVLIPGSHADRLLGWWALTR